MYSYPNQIPLSAAIVNTIVAALKPFEFDRLYGGWFEAVVPTAAKAAVERSAARYVRMISP